MLDFPLSVVIHGTKLFFPIKPSMIGQTLSHYHITDHIMQGALGEVYLADDTTQNRQVLLKILSTKIRRDANRIRRIREDVEAAAKLSHPAMARIYGLEQSVDDTGLSIQFILWNISEVSASPTGFQRKACLFPLFWPGFSLFRTLWSKPTGEISSIAISTSVTSTAFSRRQPYSLSI